MILVATALMVVQPTAWEVTPQEASVGDTLVLERVVVVNDPTAEVSLIPLESSELVEPLRDPEVLRGGTGFVVRYTVALFAPGDHTVPMPDLELAYSDGRTGTLPGGQVFVTVAALLPEGDSLPPPRGLREPVLRAVTRSFPVVLLVVAVLMSTVVWGLVRKRPPQRPEWERVEDGDATLPLMRWIAAGEHRAVATVAMHRVRDRVAELVPQADQSLHIEEWLKVTREHRPEWPLRELADVMRTLERASFAPAIPSDVIALADAAEVLLQSLEPAEVEQA